MYVHPHDAPPHSLGGLLASVRAGQEPAGDGAVGQQVEHLEDDAEMLGTEAVAV